MRHADYLTTAAVETERFAAAAAALPPDARVPTCPGWTAEDLVTHVVHLSRGVAWFLETGHLAPPSLDDVNAWLPTTTEPAAAQLRTVLAGLRAADPAAQCWTLWPTESPVTFWARRHAHELTVHRVDLELAAGRPVTPIAADFAEDGIDELLTYLTRPAGPLTGQLDIALQETGARLRKGCAECTISGPAAQLYLLLWNRSTDVAIDGDPAVLEAWRASARWTFG